MTAIVACTQPVFGVPRGPVPVPFMLALAKTVFVLTRILIFIFTLSLASIFIFIFTLTFVYFCVFEFHLVLVPLSLSPDRDLFSIHVSVFMSILQSLRNELCIFWYFNMYIIGVHRVVFFYMVFRTGTLPQILCGHSNTIHTIPRRCMDNLWTE